MSGRATSRCHRFFQRKRLIGMVHLGALPGSPRDKSNFAEVIQRAVADAHALEAAGADAVLVENFHDAPFARDRAAPHTIAAATVAVMAVREAVSVPVGVNILRNDVCSALAVAHVCGGLFVRCNVFVGAAVTDQGIIQGAAHDSVLYRKALGADTWIWADVGVKHASQLGSQTLEQQARDAVERGMADAVIVSGPATGEPTSLDDLRAVRGAVPSSPLLVGSGLNEQNAQSLMEIADGAIIGSSVKLGGDRFGPVDPDTARAVMSAARRHRG